MIKMFYNNNDERIWNMRDKELWDNDTEDYELETCEHCGELLEKGYYDINNFKLCEKCAKLEFKESFEELENLEELKQTCEYDSIEQLIEETIEEDLYKFWKSF